MGRESSAPGLGERRQEGPLGVSGDGERVSAAGQKTYTVCPDSSSQAPFCGSPPVRITSAALGS